MGAHSDKKSLIRLNTVEQAETLGLEYLQEMELDNAIESGLPEIDDR